MDSGEQMLRNAREAMGYHDLRSLEELGYIGQEDMELRLDAAQDADHGGISLDAAASIYAFWLQEQVLYRCAVPDRALVDRWVAYLACQGLDEAAIVAIWNLAALNSLHKWLGAMGSTQVRDIRNAITSVIRVSYTAVGSVAPGMHHFPDAPAATVAATAVSEASEAMSASWSPPTPNRELTGFGTPPEQHRFDPAGTACADCYIRGTCVPIER